jgi:hypothetical protein
MEKMEDAINSVSSKSVADGTSLERMLWNFSIFAFCCSDTTKLLCLLYSPKRMVNERKEKSYAVLIISPIHFSPDRCGYPGSANFDHFHYPNGYVHVD